MTSVPLLDLKAQYAAIRDEIREAMDRVVEAQHFILGPEVEGLEREVAEYSQCTYGVGVSSGTDALLIALMAIDLQPGDEVIAPSYTFFATAGAVARLGGRTVFAEIDPHTYNMDPAKLEAAITPRTRAIIPVHLYGQMADMDPILEIARKHNLVVIEDAAQAIGSEYHGRRAGSLGDFACFSFFPSKNLGGFGDGGMVTTNDPAHAEKLRLLRNHGYKPKYYNKIVGGNFRLDALQAAVLRVKLRHLDSWTAARQANAERYRAGLREAGILWENWQGEELEDGRGYVAPRDAGYGRHIYNQFVLRSSRRDALMAYLKECGIGSEIYYPVPLHLQECFTGLGYSQGDFPASERAANETFAVPIYPELTEEQIVAVVSALTKFAQGS